MLRLAAAAALAALPAAAQDAARWGPVAESLGLGSGICPASEDRGETIVCAVVLCEEGGLTLGTLGTGHGGEQSPFRGRIEVDGQAIDRDMESRVLMQDFLHVRTPVEPGEPLWQRLRAGSRLALSSSPDGDPLDYPLRGSAVELDRVASGCR
jgi:hypothetical protein